ncbi:facilitated trehalose transporter Tret1-like [Eupeodes corollae]|uniref:facilitated trehalose transporter Tret1-like n=1 Tax=Eupeodes corollae TaxID=290404 RepID=UPI002493583A|nr:facilitated trehalose transporter Tret1-like [Eupeodes corollae]
MYIKGFFGKYRIFLVAICANMMGFCIGSYIGWTSPVTPKLREQTPDSPLNFSITATQEGWIGSLISIGAFISSLFVGDVANAIGRKWTLLFSSLFIIVSYIFLILTTDVWFIYVARFLQGLGGAGGGAVVPMYIGEIATDDNRGALGSLITIFVLSGILYTYIIGPHVSYLAFQYCCIAIPILFFVTFLFMPESPYYYAMKGDKPNLIDSLQILRGKSANEVEDEASTIQKEVDDCMSNQSRIVDIIHNHSYRKALLIVCGLLFLQQMSGTTAVTFNSQSIFIDAGTNLDPALATILLGLVQLMSNLLTPFVIERAGRKKMLLVSSIGMSIALIALGVFFYIQAFGNASKVMWLPIPALIMFNIFFGFGFGPIPWAMSGEMIPPNIKSTATVLAGTSTCVALFVVTRWFPELNALGSYYAFWVFGLFSILGFVFVYFFVIETKGLSLHMIQEKLQSS